MWINSIVISNLGSYEGVNAINISSDKEHNIILIGGRNGAGKTTLFESIRLCLYGNKAFGYEVLSYSYKKYINSLINDSSKLDQNSIAYVLLDLDIDDGQDNDNYLIKRSWSNSNETFELLEVCKNGEILDSDSVEDFKNFLMDIIPPELFDLYFFDGEQIAEYFLGDAEGDRLKKAFLTLCGYDTLAIMLENFNRLVKTKKTNNTVSDYLAKKEQFEKDQDDLRELEEKKASVNKEIHDCDSAILALEADYRKRGGVTEEEWRQKNNQLKEQETLRESLNSEMKNLSNNCIPFIILKGEIQNLREQIFYEDKMDLSGGALKKLQNMLPTLLRSAMVGSGLLFSDDQLHEVSESMMRSLESGSEDAKSFLDLSLPERDALLSQINGLMQLDKQAIIDNRKKLNHSYNVSKQLRDELSKSSIEYIKAYNEKKNDLESKICTLSENLHKLEDLELSSQERLSNSEIALSKVTKDLESELKKNSVIDLSGKSAVMLDKLIATLVDAKIKQVEDVFLEKINQLKQKDSFISKIRIDEQFFIHAYKGIEKNNGIVIEEEIDKSRLSKGEKQVFIMALYWAIMSLSRTTVPFMIDTPFARIDSEHRGNITRHFFKELPGQIIIFSTDEELVGENYQIISDKVGLKLLLENKSNIKTTIHEGIYFEG